MFGQLKDYWRGITMRFCRCAHTFGLSFVCLALIQIFSMSAETYLELHEHIATLAKINERYYSGALYGKLFLIDCLVRVNKGQAHRKYLGGILRGINRDISQ